MTLRTLITTDALAARLGDPAVAIVDCRYKLEDESWGHGEYEAGHVPGAVYAHLGHDLAGARTGRNGRHPLPSVDDLTRTFSRLGIGAGVQVVAYDQDAGMYAARLWWLLRWLGHDAVAVLDGGFAKWLAEHRQTKSGVETRPPADFRGAIRPNQVLTAKDVAAVSQKADWRVIDARGPERFRGETEPIDRVAGHIPGAANHFFKWSLTDAGTFGAPEELRAKLTGVTGNVTPDHVVCYCGSGVTACHNLLALEHAGIRGARLYPGSWSEWSSDPSRPVETGAEKKKN